MVRGNFVNDSREGLWLLKDGAIYLYNFKNNLLNDTTYQFYGDSSLNSKSVYKDGKLNGPSFYYRAEHSKDQTSIKYNLWKVENFKANEWHGSKIQLFSNADTATIEYYENNLPKGIHKHFAFNGKLIEWHQFKEHPDYKLLDTALYWNDSGLLRRTSNQCSNRAQTPNFARTWDTEGKLIFNKTKYILDKIY